MATRGRKNKNWILIKSDYVIEGLTPMQLSKKYPMSAVWIGVKAKEEEWKKEREEYLSTTLEKNKEEAQEVYKRNRAGEAAKFAGLKRKLKKLIDDIISNSKIGNPKDVADLSRAICLLEQTEATLCGETTQITQQNVSANIQQVVADLGGLTREELQKKFQEEKKRLTGAGSGMTSLPEPEKPDNDK